MSAGDDPVAEPASSTAVDPQPGSPGMSSPPPQPPQPPNAASASKDNSYAFLVHSQHTLPHNLPPSVDNKTLARQRRRRTSPEDQVILESEFQRNPKPDKAARQRIVERVALGDKEVQNRRQTSRRKSRPLDPVDANAVDNPSSSAMLHSETSNLSSDPSELLSSSPRLAPVATPVRPNEASRLPLLAPRQTFPLTPAQIQEDTSFSFGLQTSAALGRVSPSQESHNETETQLASSSMPEASASRHHVEDMPQTPLPTPLAGPRSLKRSASTVRLSLKSDFTAKISQADESSPSPPNLQRTIDLLSPQPARAGLRRSRSAVNSYEAGSSSATKKSSDMGLSGRSRDSRAWEFWCDREARTDLMKKAEQETRGSAADAISLIRSSSKRSTLSPINLSRAVGSDISGVERRVFKRVKSSHGQFESVERRERQPLGRSQTSVGRLESQGKKRDSGIGMDVYDDENVSSPIAFKKKPMTLHSPSGDSDKENNDPDGNGLRPAPDPAHRRTGIKPGRSRPGLSPSRTAPLGASRRFGTMSDANRALGRRRVRSSKVALQAMLSQDENANPEDDEEIAMFMRRSPSSASLARSSPGNRDEDDMDCVQGLLRLSQGAWR